MAELTLVNGLIGGIVATIVMTVFMMALGDDSPPPTALFWSQYVGDGEPDEYVMQGMVLHLLYGTVAGAIFALAAPEVLTVDGMTTSVLAGLGYGVVLFVGAAVFWMRFVLGMEPEPQQVGAFVLFHLIYGGVLGAVVQFGPV